MDDVATSLRQNRLDLTVDQPSTAASTSNIGKHTILEGDCLNILKGFPDQSFDVVVTSPPYNLNISYSTYQDNLTESEYIRWIMEICHSIKRVLKEDGSFFLNISGSNADPWIPFELITRLRKIFVLQNHISWVKSITMNDDSKGHFKPISGNRFMHHNHEHIFHLTRKGNVHLDRLSIGIPFKDKSNISRWGHKKDVRCRGNTWFIPYKTVNSKSQKYNHPGTFPTQLPLWCIWLHGRPEPRVLDPFLGIGTTMVAGHDAGALVTGIEIDHRYAQLAKQRLEGHIASTMQVTLTAIEMSELLKQDPSTRSDGGFQALLVGLQDKLNKTTGKLSLSADELEKIPRYAFDYKNGGWEDRLKGIFARELGPTLRRA